MKLCGCKEPCFVNGERAWGYCGSVMCLHLSEKHSEPENISVCGLTDEEVNLYTSETEYKEAQQQLQPENVLPVCWNESCSKWSEDICQSPGKCIEDVSG